MVTHCVDLYNLSSSLDMLTRIKNTCEDVTLITAPVCSELDKHRIMKKKLTEAARQIRNSGMSVSLEIDCAGSSDRDLMDNTAGAVQFYGSEIHPLTVWFNNPAVLTRENIHKIIRAVRSFSPKTKIGYRTDFSSGKSESPVLDLKSIFDSVCRMAYEASFLTELSTGLCADISCGNSTAYSKSHGEILFSALMYLAAGATDISLDTSVNPVESPEFYDKITRTFSSAGGYIDKLSQINELSRSCGVSVFIPDYIDRQKYGSLFDHLYKSGIPVTFNISGKGACAYLLHLEVAKQLKKEDVDYLLSNKVLLDRETLDFLRSKGFIEHIGKMKVIDFAPRENPDFPDLPQDKNSRHYDMAIAYEEGGIWAVLANDPWNPQLTVQNRNRIVNTIEFASNISLPAIPESGEQLMIFPRELVGPDNSTNTVAVTVINCTPGRSESVSLEIRRPMAKRFVMLSPNESESKVMPYYTENDSYVVNLPALPPLSIVTIMCA